MWGRFVLDLKESYHCSHWIATSPSPQNYYYFIVIWTNRMYNKEITNKKRGGRVWITGLGNSKKGWNITGRAVIHKILTRGLKGWILLRPTRQTTRLIAQTKHVRPCLDDLSCSASRRITHIALAHCTISSCVAFLSTNVHAYYIKQ